MAGARAPAAATERAAGAHTGKGGSHASGSKGCAVWGIAMLGTLSALGYGAVELAARALS